MSIGPSGDVSYQSAHEAASRTELIEHLFDSPIPRDQLMSNLGLFVDSKALARLLFLHHIYCLAVPIPGVVMDFGTRWGQNAAVFSALRGIYEPFNRHRRIVAFDTFTGFPSVHQKDGGSGLMSSGQLATGEAYADILRDILKLHENLNPLSHISKYEVVRGDAMTSVPDFLSENPQTIVALAYFDFDLYEPTKAVLEHLSERLTRGSVVAFDELNDQDSPGETLALAEVFGLSNIALRRLPITSRTSYFVVE